MAAARNLYLGFGLFVISIEISELGLSNVICKHTCKFCMKRLFCMLTIINMAAVRKFKAVA